MDTQPFRTNVLNDDGSQIGFVVWVGAGGKRWRAYRFAGQAPIGIADTKEEAIQIVRKAYF
jgi:hypothetical protein